MAVTIEGVVEAVSVKNRETKKGILPATSFKVNGEWYSGGFKTWEVDKGDEVSLTYETNARGYKDVKGIAVTAKNPGAATPANTGVPRPGRSFPIDPLAPERTINRQNALTAAAHLIAALWATGEVDVNEPLHETVVALAREFEAYTTGDIDREEALGMLGEE